MLKKIRKIKNHFLKRHVRVQRPFFCIFSISFLIQKNILCVDLWTDFNLVSELDATACWCCEWCLAVLAENWDVRVWECCCELCARWATEGNELWAWVWNKCLLLVHAEFFLLWWVENVAIECWHIEKKDHGVTFI